MAYNDYSMGGYIPGDYETEEERRRRLEAEQAQAQDQENGISQQPAAARGVNLGDLATQYIGRRIDQAGQNVNSAMNTMAMPQQAVEQPDAGNTEVQSQQVKTYADGSQEEIVKRQMPAPVAPTPVAMPQVQPQIQPQPQVQAQPMPQPVPQPQAQPQPAPLPAAPVSPEEQQRQEAMVRAVQQQAQNLPQPGPGVQVAGAPGAPMPVIQQAPAGAPGASLAQVGQAVTTRPQWAVDLEAAGTDQTKLIDIAANRAYPQDVRDDAKAKLRTAMAAKDAETQAQQTVLAAAQGDPKAQQKLLNSIKPAAVKREEQGPVTEGSYIRAYLYARLGLNDLAKEEQEKILGRSKFGQVIVDGAAYEVENDPRSGRILTARDSEGNKVDTPILNKIRAESNAAKSVVTHTGKMQDVTTGEVYYEQTTPNGIRLVDNNGKVYKGSSASLRPFGIGSDISTKNQIQLNELQNKLAYAGPTASAAEREKVLAESEAKYGPLPETYKAAVRAGQPMPTGTATGGAVMQPAPAAGAPGVTTTPAAAPVAGAPRPTGPVNPAAPLPAAPLPAAPVVGGVGIGGATPAGRESAQKISEAAATSVIDINKNLEEQKNKVRMSMPASEQNATSILNTLNDIVTHPGLDKTVGYPKIMTGLIDKIPSSDSRAFRQKYDQLGGQEFLAAYNQLRGGGGISEIEGLKAEQAISALKDTGISSAEFKKNMWILRDAVQSGIDNQRRLIGQAPKYQESPEREAAKTWLREHPNSPKAEAVRKKLVGY